MNCFKMNEEKLIPVEQVLDDMYSDSAYSDAARDYYYMYYADDEEREQMDFEEKLVNIISYSIAIGFVAIVIFGICSGIIVF